MKQLKYSLLLLLTATIWGTAFVAQSQAMDSVGPLAFNAARMFVGGVVLLPVIRLMDALRHKGGEPAAPGSKRDLAIGGLCCGVVADTNFLLISTYSLNGADPELIAYKKR